MRIVRLLSWLFVLTACATPDRSIVEMSGALKLAGTSAGDAIAGADAHCRSEGSWSEVRYWDYRDGVLYFECAKR